MLILIRWHNGTAVYRDWQFCTLSISYSLRKSFGRVLRQFKGLAVLNPFPLEKSTQSPYYQGYFKLTASIRSQNGAL